MMSIDKLLYNLKMNDKAMYDKLSYVCRREYEQAGIEFRKERKLPQHSHYHSGVSYTLALQNYFLDLNEVQCNAFFKALRGERMRAAVEAGTLSNAIADRYNKQK